MISIIIPCYNYGHLVGETINSVLSQTYSDYECIVIDDGSFDNTRFVINEFKKRDNRIIYIYQQNTGLPAARNTGLSIAKGDYIAFLDADDLWSEKKLDNQIATFNDKKADIVFSNTIYFAENIKNVLSVSDLDFIDDPIKLINRNIVPGSASSVIISRRVFEMIGYFDNNLRSLEDIDYWYRCLLKGFKFWSTNSRDVYVRQTNNSMSSNYIKMYYAHLICLEKQILLLEGHKVEMKNYKLELLGRLSLISWYAGAMNRTEYELSTHVLGLKLLSFFYFRRRLINIIHDSVRFLFHL